MGKTPARMFYQRQLRTIIPSAVPHKSVSKSVKKPYPIKHPKDFSLPELKPGDNVRLRKGKIWSRKGKIIEKLKQPRSYNVRVGNGNILRRNRRHIMKTKEDFEFSSEDVSSDETSTAERTLLPQVDHENHPVEMHAEDNVHRTRSGRTIRIPDRYSDYDMSV